MTMRQFYDWQTAGGGDDVSLLVATLERRKIAWCMIGDLAVNHWAREPIATADVDLVIAAENRCCLCVSSLTEYFAAHQWHAHGFVTVICVPWRR